MKIFRILLYFIKTRWINNFSDRSKLKKYQERKIKKYIKYIRKKSPYFKENLKKLYNLEVLDELSNFIMDKTFMMDNFDSLNTLGVKKEEVLKIALQSEKTRDFSKKYKKYSVGLSSGTSGHRGVFITTKKEQSIWAGVVLAKMLPKGHLLNHKIAFFLRADNDLYKSVNSPFIKLEYFDTFKDIKEHINRLNLLKPTILIAPVSILVRLSNKKKEGLLNINPIKIISVAEILEKEDEKYIAKSFNINIIHQIYQATEGFLAYTCNYGYIHLNEDIIKFEKDYIDENRFYPIITDFTRTSQPFIKYKLNDILVESKDKNRCECGSIFEKIERIEGRSDDIFKFINKKGEIIEVFPDFIRRCMILTENIREYQVFQVDYSTIEISVSDITENQKTNILNEFKLLLDNMNVKSKDIKIKFIDYNPDNTVKLKRICQKMKNNT